jgi:hypothetical protein
MRSNMLSQVCIVLAFLIVLTQCSTDRQLNAVDIIPSNQALSASGETAQYKAVGHFTRSPITEDITNKVTWSSSDVSVALT